MVGTDRTRRRTTDGALALGSLLVGAAGAVAWGALEAHRFTLRELTVPVLATGARPVRVLHLSDLHLIPTQADKIAWVRDLAALSPDLVVDTGDNFGHADALVPLLGALDPLLTFPGAFVLGSNDYFAPRPKNPLRYFLRDSRLPEDRTHERRPDLPHEAFAAALRDAGWSDLTNRRDSRTLAGDGHVQRVELVGVDDPHIDRDVFPAPAAAATSGTSVPTVLRLGVTHAPYTRVLDAMVDDGAGLVLAGHTHGGQLCVPGFGALVTNCDIDRARVSGLHGWPGARPDEPGGEDSSWLHVSAGVGTSPQVRLRFACPPTASLLTLVERASA